MKKFLIFSLFLFISAVLSNTVLANFPDVIINEIAWMGMTNSANDEWLELFNNTDNSINLDGWQLISQDGTPKIILSGIIPANSFYLLERTNDDTVPGISADKIYTGALGNGGEYLKLYNNLNNIVDEVDSSAGWLAGNNATKQTMEKTSTGWQTSENPGGTPKGQNSAGTIIESPNDQKINTTNPTPNAQNPDTAIPTPNTQNLTPKIIYPDGIIFNEILPSPEGPDQENEWIEIYNQNNFEIDLAGWRIKDNEGKSAIYVFPDKTKIGSNNYLVLTRPQTKITLNNTGDKLILVQPDGKIADAVIYGKSLQGQSYSKINADWVWSSTLTPGLANIVADDSIKEKSEEALVKNEQIVASLNQTNPKPRSFLFVFLVALGIAVSSIIIFFLFKNRV